jgi:glycosyltransferase involved in cell wall biosynthesis
MRVAVVAPRPVPPLWGGTERAVAAMRRAIDDLDGHTAEVVELPVDETNLCDLIDAYRRFAALDLTAYDRVISVKYPAWMIDHPDHVVHMFHPLRGLYDAYEAFGLPLVAEPRSAHAAGILELIGRHNDRAAVEEFFDRFAALVAAEGRDAPDLAFPGPFARAIVHWLDAIALTPPRARAHFAISATVVARPEYFPRGLRPRVLPLPTELPLDRPETAPGHTLFTASRLDAPKRLDLVIDAMGLIEAPVRLAIAGTGPLDADLRARAADDPRIEFLGFVPDTELVDHYRGAIAVPFVPFDEDQGLICMEAASQGTPVVTCADSGGPAEFVVDGVTGLIAEPTAAHLARAIERVVADPIWARRMGQAAHRRAAARTWPDAARILLGLPPGRRTDRAVAAGRATDRRTASPQRRRPHAVVLSTYGIDAPAHGGELRVHHLCRALAKVMDVDVLALDAAPGARRSTTHVAPGLTSTIVPRGPGRARAQDDLGSLLGQSVTDVYAGVDVHHTPDYLDLLRHRAADADLVILEHPFLHPALAEAGVDLPVLVDTHNVEFDLRVAGLEGVDAATPVLELLFRVERDALRAADAVSACSAVDADRLAELYGIDRSSITVVPNGSVVPRTFRDLAARRRAHDHWFDRLRWTWGAHGTSELVVFFGSWHPPNVDAAEYLVELATNRDDLYVVSAGHHGAVFGDRRLPRNIVFPGVVTATAKATLLACASVALNPMRIGSGTNLKLIEFLGHGVPTVTTPFGARGLGLTDEREALVVGIDGFEQAIDRALNDPAATAERSRAGWELARRHDWHAIGVDYRALVGRVLGTPLVA